MSAEPLLGWVLEALAAARLEVVMIGNAAAALQGAPVTTVDFDFMFRETPANLVKLKKVARHLEAMILRPYYPASGLYRLVNEDQGLQADFLHRIHGVRRFESLRSRAARLQVGKWELWVADLGDIIASKRAANRPRDRAVIAMLERTLHEKKRVEKGEAAGAQARKRA
jgi:hypothetical protein